LPFDYGSGEFGSPAVSRDGKLLAELRMQEVMLWDISDRTRPRQRFPISFDSREAPTVAAFSRDGKLLVVGYYSGVVALYDLAQPDKPKILRAAESVRPDYSFNYVTGVAVSDDGKTVASSGYATRLIYLWDASTASPTLIGNLGGSLTDPNLAGTNASALAFSHDGRSLVSGSDRIILWDIDPLSWRERACTLSGVACPPPKRKR
jgi:WD40 repeat protein